MQRRRRRLFSDDVLWSCIFSRLVTKAVGCLAHLETDVEVHVQHHIECMFPTCVYYHIDALVCGQPFFDTTLLAVLEITIGLFQLQKPRTY